MTIIEVNDRNEIKLKKGWEIASSECNLTNFNGRPLIEIHQRSLSCFVRTSRIMLGTALVICGICFLWLKSLRDLLGGLFTKSKEQIFYVKRMTSSSTIEVIHPPAQEHPVHCSASPIRTPNKGRTSSTSSITIPLSPITPRVNTSHPSNTTSFPSGGDPGSPVISPASSSSTNISSSSNPLASPARTTHDNPSITPIGSNSSIGTTPLSPITPENTSDMSLCSISNPKSPLISPISSPSTNISSSSTSFMSPATTGSTFGRRSLASGTHDVDMSSELTLASPGSIVKSSILSAGPKTIIRNLTNPQPGFSTPNRKRQTPSRIPLTVVSSSAATPPRKLFPLQLHSNTDLNTRIEKLLQESIIPNGESFEKLLEAYSDITVEEFVKCISSRDVHGVASPYPIIWELNEQSILTLLEMHQQNPQVFELRLTTESNTLYTYWIEKRGGVRVLEKLIEIDPTLADVDLFDACYYGILANPQQTCAEAIFAFKTKSKPLSESELWLLHWMHRRPFDKDFSSERFSKLSDDIRDLLNDLPEYLQFKPQDDSTTTSLD